MDDALEQPKPLPTTDAANLSEEDNDEEDGPDWSSIPLPGKSAFIPKRGEKDYEPRATSSLQQHLLEKARSAMFAAIGGTRGTNSKAISYGVWEPSLSRTHVTLARGVHFASLGVSVQRESGAPKRLELYPEEALYMIERGSLFCWKQVDGLPGEGAPMSVQQAYAEMLGREGITLEHYQVYAYLKRLGYSVLRTTPPIAPTSPRLWRCIVTTISAFFTRISFFTWSIFIPRDWWRPRVLHGWTLPRDYPSLFRRLRIIPSGHDIPLHTTHLRHDESPYRIFFDVYKPGRSFRKTEPPPPDFQVAVVNARTTPMPTIHELAALFDAASDWPASNKPRRATPSSGNKVPQAAPSTSAEPIKGQWWAWWSWLSFRRVLKAPTTRPMHPFVALRAGTKSVVIAVVDAGTITCYRFNRGAFDAWPMA